MATREEHARADSPVERSIALAKDGSFSALGRLLDQYRDYLLRVAAGEITHDLVVKVAPSDVVQDTFIQAVRGFPQFVGTEEADLRAWLRQILLHNIRDARKPPCTQKMATSLFASAYVLRPRFSARDR